MSLRPLDERGRYSVFLPLSARRDCVAQFLVLFLLEGYHSSVGRGGKGLFFIFERQLQVAGGENMPTLNREGATGLEDRLVGLALVEARPCYKILVLHVAVFIQTAMVDSKLGLAFLFLDSRGQAGGPDRFESELAVFLADPDLLHQKVGLS
jgi:hypothetical protein